VAKLIIWLPTLRVTSTGGPNTSEVPSCPRAYSAYYLQVLAWRGLRPNDSTSRLRNHHNSRRTTSQRWGGNLGQRNSIFPSSMCCWIYISNSHLLPCASQGRPNWAIQTYWDRQWEICLCHRRFRTLYRAPVSSWRRSARNELSVRGRSN
jgi:hypothetical protein